MLVDQQSFDLATATTGTSIVGVGQSFTPTLAAIDFVQFSLAGANLGSSVFVNLRSSSMTGTILGTTDTQAVSLDPRFPVTFSFLSSVSLSPGTQYFLEPVVAVNNGTVSITISDPLSNPNPYQGGTEFHAGAPAGLDLWFSEGIIVPEPSIWTLLGLGGVVMFAVGARKGTACRAAIPRRACTSSTQTGVKSAYYAGGPCGDQILLSRSSMPGLVKRMRRAL